MLLKSVELENVCQHADLKLKFGPGVTGIFGANGAGKSNLVNMIQASVTGDFGVNAGKKEDNIRHDAPENAASRITTSWEHDGLPFQLVRSLRPNSQRLLVGDHKFTKAGEITDELVKLLGVSRHVIDEYVFVGQWKIFDFISADPATRMRSFMRLCQVDKAEYLWTLLGNQIKADQPMVVFVDDDRRTLRAKLREQKIIAAEAQQVIAEHELGLLTSEDIADLKAVITQWQQTVPLKSQLRQVITDLQAAQKKFSVVEPGQLAAQKEYEAGAEEMEQQFRPWFADVKRRYTEQQQSLKYEARRAELQVGLKTEPPVEPACVEGYEASQAIAVTVKTLRAQESALVQRINLFEEDGVVECPTCGTSVSNLADSAEHWESELAGLVTEIEEECRRHRICLEYEQAHRLYLDTLNDRQRRINAAELELAGLPAPVSADEVITREDYEKACSEIKEAEDYLKALNVRRTEAGTEVAKLQGSIEALQKQKTAIVTKQARCLVSQADHDAAELRLREHEQASQEVWKQRSALTAAQCLIAEYSQDIARITQVLEQNRSAKTWVDDLQSWREVFHREALPRVVTQTVMESMVDQINDTLELFNGPFRVTAEDKLTFLARKPRGYVEEAARLSGGEKVILGLAFRFSVAGQVGMMVLDEPTAGLDADNIECLVDMLEHVSEITREKGQQVIIITHDHRLERVLDHKIEIRRL